MRYTPLIVFMLLICMSTAVIAQTGHMTLLAVAQSDKGEYKGSTADLELTIEPGEGRVFLETVPLSKVDTQISTRFAKEIACKLIDKDCDKYDFFYTIRSNAALLGGPSAGGAITALTTAMLDKQDIRQDVAISGTINSGNLIGPVGHLKEKIEAAKENEMTLVLIPSGQRHEETLEEFNLTDNSTYTVNETVDLYAYGEELGIEVREVVSVEDALQAFTGKDYHEQLGPLIVSEDYTSVMKGLAEDLCENSENIRKEVDSFELDENQTKKYKRGVNLTTDSEDAYNNGSYYSAASYCFTSGLEFRRLLYKLQELNITKKAEELTIEIAEFDQYIDEKERDTLTDLQAYMIVKERILEAQEGLKEELNEDVLAYVTERLYSARSWSKFFGIPGESFELSDEDLKESCEEKLGELGERIQFAAIFFPGVSTSIESNYQLAYKYYEDEQYALCLFKASKTTAEANVLVSIVGVSEDELDKIIENKFLSAERAVTKQTEQIGFPIVAYSYYEYGQTLSVDDKYSGLVYSEYALELSNLDMYFKQKEQFSINLERADPVKIGLLLFGLIIGFIVGRLSVKKISGTHTGKIKLKK